VGYLYGGKLIVCGEPDELREIEAVNPAGTRRVELEVPSPSQDVPRLKQIDGVIDATPYGRTVHLLASNSLSDSRLIEESGLDAGEANLRPTGPSLEDVFFTLSRAAEKGEMPVIDGKQRITDLAEHDASELDTPNSAPPPGGPMFGFKAMLRKEFAHLFREPVTLFFMFVVPIVQLTIFGYAIETQIEHIPTVVYNVDGRADSWKLVEAFQNSRVFRVVDYVFDNDSFRRALTSGKANVGIKIPPDYSDRLLRSQQAQVQVLIDGSDSQTATTALNAASLLGTNRSIATARSLADALERVPARDEFGVPSLPIDVRPRLLYNPDLESSHFFVPGLLAIILQLVTLFLTSFAVVRERELGTLEQLFVTPVGRAALVLGKLVPYALIGFVETLCVLWVMVYVFGVPIEGSVPLLVVLSLLFLVCGLGLGLLVSTLARTQFQAMQFAFLIMLPSVLLSGFVFPRSQMPLPIYLITFLIPVTYFVEIMRGIVLRGADLIDLWPQVFSLAVCCAAILLLAIARFRKQLT
jgi:ABC transporter DrrB family efflux protein